MSFKIEKIHHVAYRCKDAKETVEWYKKYLNMDFILAFAEDHVPSTKAFDPYMHEALGSESSDSVTPGHVSRVFKKAYKYHDKILRPAQVIVAKESTAKEK